MKLSKLNMLGLSNADVDTLVRARMARPMRFQQNGRPYRRNTKRFYIPGLESNSTREQAQELLNAAKAALRLKGEEPVNIYVDPEGRNGAPRTLADALEMLPNKWDKGAKVFLPTGSVFET